MIKAIKNKTAHKAALKRIYELLHATPSEGSEEYNELEILAILVDDYESKQFPIELPDPVEAIKFRLEQSNLEPSDLAVILGSKSRASEVLNRKRKLSLSMIRALNQKLNIPAESLIGKY